MPLAKNCEQSERKKLLKVKEKLIKTYREEITLNGKGKKTGKTQKKQE